MAKSSKAPGGAWTSVEAPPGHVPDGALEHRFVRRQLPLVRELVRLPGFLRNYARDSHELYRLLGDVFCRRLGAPSVYLCHPDLVRHVFRTNVRNYVKGPDYRFLRPLLGQGIFVSEGDLWTRQRRLLAPEFREREVARFFPLMDAELDRLSRAWAPAVARGEPIDVGASMQEFALRVIGGAMFQSDFGSVAPQIAESIGVILSHATWQMVSRGLLAPWLPTPGNRRARKAERVFDRIVADLITMGHGSHSQGGCPIAVSGIDVVSRMLVAKDQDTGQPMSEQQLVDEVKTLILSGYETTGIAMSWTLYLLARHPEVRTRLVEEVDAVCGSQPVELGHMEKLVYLRQVLFESMRLYPPVPGVTRTALADDSFEGVEIRAGESITVPCYTLHRHPEFWADPERFDPERFAPEKLDAIEPYSYLPFLRGRRACLGEHFAMLEAQVTLATLLVRYEFELMHDEPIGIRPISTLRLDRPLSMRVQARGG